MSKYKANIKAKDIKKVLSKETFDSSFFLLFDKYCRLNEFEHKPGAFSHALDVSQA
tara:strand:- start:30 stop:197 length:168 start_codon:yes stop_codon:yes gene_type:complete